MGASSQTFRSLTLLIGAVLLFSGCSAAPDDRNSFQAAPQSVEADLTIRGTHYDYEIYESLTEMAKSTSFALVGEIVGWQQGREARAGDSARFTALAKIRVEETFLASRELGEFVYLEVDRGYGTYTPEGLDVEITDTPDLYNYSTVEQMSEGIPSGTRVLLLANEAGTAEALKEASDGTAEYVAGEPLPDDAMTLRAVPQGLFYETHDGGYLSGLVEQEEVAAFGAWPGGPDYVGREGLLGFEALTDELRRL